MPWADGSKTRSCGRYSNVVSCLSLSLPAFLTKTLCLSSSLLGHLVFNACIALAYPGQFTNPDVAGGEFIPGWGAPQMSEQLPRGPAGVVPPVTPLIHFDLDVQNSKFLLHWRLSICRFGANIIATLSHDGRFQCGTSVGAHCQGGRSGGRSDHDRRGTVEFVSISKPLLWPLCC